MRGACANGRPLRLGVYLQIIMLDVFRGNRQYHTSTPSLFRLPFGGDPSPKFNSPLRYPTPSDAYCTSARMQSGS